MVVKKSAAVLLAVLPLASEAFSPLLAQRLQRVSKLRPTRPSLQVGSRRCRTVASAEAEDTAAGPKKTDWDAYISACRPGNLPASAIFVYSGAWAATKSWAPLLQPSVFLVAFCTMLITTTSMVANDYFDYRLGTDSEDTKNVIVQGEPSVRYLPPCLPAFLPRWSPSRVSYLILACPT